MGSGLAVVAVCVFVVELRLDRAASSGLKKLRRVPDRGPIHKAGEEPSRVLSSRVQLLLLLLLTCCCGLAFELLLLLLLLLPFLLLLLFVHGEDYQGRQRQSFE